MCKEEGIGLVIPLLGVSSLPYEPPKKKKWSFTCWHGLRNQPPRTCTSVVSYETQRSWNVSEGEQWSRDYSELQPYRSGVASTTSFVPGPPPQMYYLDRNSNVSMLKRAFLPTFAPFELGSVEEDLRPLVTDEEVLLLAKAGVHTVSDLISADRNTVLNMRGHEIPQV